MMQTTRFGIRPDRRARGLAAMVALVLSLVLCSATALARPPAATAPSAKAAPAAPNTDATKRPAPNPNALPNPSDPNFAVKLLTRFDDLYRGQKSESVMRMDVTTKHWRRSLKMRSWSLGKDYSLVRILAPKKERGTATLKVKKDLYTWLGKIGRLIKVGSGMMGGAWMGSHFTNDDLVRETRVSEDFTIKRLADSKVGGAATWVFQLTPRPNKPVPWGKVIVSLRQSDGLPTHQHFHDEDGKLVRVMEFSAYKRTGGRLLPTQMKMLPKNRPGESTVVTIESQNFAPKIDRGFFSLGRLKSM